MPVLFPNMVFYEEGSYEVFEKSREDPVMVVSPDGTLRQPRHQTDNLVKPAEASIEIKCPFSFTQGFPVYDSVPKRYIPQCLMEQLATQSKDQLLLCWTPESSTLFKVQENKYITDWLVWEVTNEYYSNPQRRPTKLLPEVKMMKTEISAHASQCEFLGEFPSALSICKDANQQSNEYVEYGSPYVNSISTNEGSSTCQSTITIEEVCQTLMKSEKVLKDIRRMYQKKASEVVVFTLSDSDRSWKREIGHGLPFGYFFKGYSLTIECMRNIAAKMLHSCTQNGIHVPCSTFDGQWFKLVETTETKPLTLFQLHRNHWKHVKGINASTLHKNICRMVEKKRDSDSNLIPPEISKDNTSTGTLTAFTLSDENKRDIAQILLTSTRKRNKFSEESVCSQRVKELFESAANMNLLTCTELRSIGKYLVSKESLTLSLKGTKANIIQNFCYLFNLSHGPSQSRKQQTNKSPPTLSALVSSRMKSFGKKYLQVTYAMLSWPETEKKWRESSPVTAVLPIEGLQESIAPTFVPQQILDDGKTFLHMNCLDGHHIRCNIRSRLCTRGTRDLNSDAWSDVAKSGSSPLSVVMLEQNRDGKILDQQNEHYIRVMFSEEVENELAAMGYTTEAQFTKLMRGWHDAEDLPGLTALQRCRNSLNLRKWLLDGYNFSAFPPAGGFVKGFPRITFEGLICNIEAHLYMYPMSSSGTYNWRSLSTLVAESLFGEIAEMESHNNGVPSGKSFKRDFSVMAGLNAVRLKPNRYVFKHFNFCSTQFTLYETLWQAKVDINRAFCNITNSLSNINNLEI